MKTRTYIKLNSGSGPAGELVLEAAGGIEIVCGGPLPGDNGMEKAARAFLKGSGFGVKIEVNMSAGGCPAPGPAYAAAALRGLNALYRGADGYYFPDGEGKRRRLELGDSELCELGRTVSEDVPGFLESGCAAVTLRKARKEDGCFAALARMREYEADLRAGRREPSEGFDFDECALHYGNRFMQPGHFGAVIEYGAWPCGSVLIRDGEEPEFELCLFDEQRGLGLGELALRTVKDFCRENGRGSFACVIRRGDERARKFFLNAGGEATENGGSERKIRFRV